MENLKALIRQRLHSSPLVARVLEERPDLRDDAAGLLAHLEEKGLVEDIFASLETTLQRQQPPQRAAPPPLSQPPPQAPPTTTGPPSAAAVPLPGQQAGGSSGSPWQLVVRLVECRALLDYLDECDAEGRELQWHVSFGRHRARSRSVPAAVDVRYEESLFFELPAAPSRSGLLTHDTPLHLVLVCRGGPGAVEDPWEPGPRHLVCSHLLEWRHCLSGAGPQKLTGELKGLGRRRQLSVGVLHAELELRPAGPPAGLIPDIGVAAQIHAEEHKREDVLRHVFEDLDRWWANYHELYKSRQIRLFAQTESSLFLPVPCFVAGVEAGRSLETPAQALRWVVLLGTEPPPPPTEGAEPRWHTLPALWAKGRATVEEKAVLLCSLLLGFSLDAWCCLGTDAQGQPHAWIIVRDQGDLSKPVEVSAWDPRSGARIPADDARYLSSFTSIDTMFNDRHLYVCHSGAVARTSFDLTDARCWLPVPLDNSAIDTLRLYPTRAPAALAGRRGGAGRLGGFAQLRPRHWGLPLEAEAMEDAIEQRIAGVMRAHREAAGLSTRFDDHLAQLLHVALVNCEFQRAFGVEQAADFESLARRLCGEDEVLQAVPAQFNHFRVSLYWPALSDRPTVRSLLAAPAASSSFAVRARIVPYPEGAVAVWVLVAAIGRF